MWLESDMDQRLPKSPIGVLPILLGLRNRRAGPVAGLKPFNQHLLATQVSGKVCTMRWAKANERWASEDSTMMRSSGSVPLGRTSTRPCVPNSA